MPWRHPIRVLPLEGSDVAEDLVAEFAAMPFGRRWQLVRKALGREAVLRLGRQGTLRRGAVPAGVRSLLWDYSWTTVGDAILDLAPRFLIPQGIDVDLLIAPHLAPLFATDGRFRNVVVREEDIAASTYDFVLLDSLRSSSLRRKARLQPTAPFATLREHNAGERFDRAAFADRRLRQLFSLPSGAVVAPRIDLGADRPASNPSSGPVQIGVALGARVAAKLYPRWKQVLKTIVAEWPDPFRPPRFLLLGSGESATAQRDEFDAGFMTAYCSDRIDSGSLRDAAMTLAGCDAFLGVDGGLMHVAVAVGTPGLALFAGNDPCYFLRPGSSMQAMTAKGRLAKWTPASIAAEFIARVSSLSPR